MSKVVSDLSGDPTVIQLRRNRRFVEELQSAQSLFNVVRRRLRENDSVFQEDEGELPADRSKGDVHCSLERFRGVLLPGWRPNDRMKAVIGSKRGFFWLCSSISTC